MKLYSFDVFDTCLARICGTPDNVFYILGEEILGANIDEALLRDFVRERYRAEKRAIISLKKEAVTIYELYNFFDISVYTNRPKQFLIEREMELERLMLVPIANTKDIIESCRSKGKIAFISDMYLPDDMLKTILMDCGFMHSEDSLYISGTIGLSKHSGKLFEYVKEVEQVKYSKWQHYGDNFKSDYILPKKMGIRCHRICYDYSKIESLWIQNSLYTPQKWVIKCFAGLARSIRVNNNVIGDDFVIDVMLPTFLPFVFCLLQKAKEDKIKRLYFASRDTYVLYLMAMRISHLFPEIEIRYLYISTKVLYPIGLSSGEKEDIMFQLRHLGKFKPKMFLTMIGFTQSEIHSIGKYIDVEKDINLNTSEKFVNLLLRNDYNEILKTHSIAKKKLLLDYLKQEKFVDGENVALFDLGWRGTSQYMLSKVLTENVSFYYFGVNKGILPIKDIGNYFSFMYVKDFDRFSSRFLEFYMCKMPEGSTLSYEEKNGKIIPICDNVEITDSEIKEFDKNLQIMFEGIDRYLQIPLLYTYSRLFYTIITLPTLQGVSQNPPYKMVKFLENRMFWDSYTDKKKIVKTMLPHTLIKVLYHSYKRSPNYSGLWIEGCVVLSLGFVGRWLLRKNFILKMKNFGKKVM